MNPWDLSRRSTIKLPLADPRQIANDHHHNSGLCIPLPSSQLDGPNNSLLPASSQSLYSLSSSPASSRTSQAELSDDTNQSEQMLGVGVDSSIAPDTASHVSITTMMDQSCSQLDRKARKKDQNRRAAYNYRRKKMEEKNRIREEEMRLVYSRVCLIGYAEELEGSITYILSTKTKKILDKEGNDNCFLCPVCLQSCDNTMNLRSHLNIIHYSGNSCS